jgi:hypothetical protein
MWRYNLARRSPTRSLSRLRLDKQAGTWGSSAGLSNKTQLNAVAVNCSPVP